MSATAAAAFHELQRDFESARARVGCVDFFYGFGPHVVRISFADDTLIPLLTAALAHRRVEAATRADLRICVWSGATAGGVAKPEVQLGSRRVAREGCIQLATRGGGERVWGLDGSRDLAMCRVDGVAAIPAHETAAPFLDILHWWMRGRGLHVVHAAAVGTAAGGVLLVGKGGSGKSTSALACAGRGLLHAGDDYCLVALGDRPLVYSLYNSAKVQAAQLAAFDHLGVEPEGWHDGKVILALYPSERDALIDRFPLRAILAVRITGQCATALRPAPPAAILRALAPSTILQLGGADQGDFARLAELSRRVPGHTLEVGSDLTLIAPAISALLGVA